MTNFWLTINQFIIIELDSMDSVLVNLQLGNLSRNIFSPHTDVCKLTTKQSVVLG